MNSPIRYLFPLVFTVLIAIPGISQGATVASDGGVTLWLSYDELTQSVDADGSTTYINPTGALLSAQVSQHDSGCSATNGGRSAQGVPDSLGSCGDGSVGQSCTGKQKLTGDLEKFARHLYEASEGTHYLRHVYISDMGRSWETADVRWNIGSGGSSASPGGWKKSGWFTNMRNTKRRCIHDVLHHEIGHYFYKLPDRYATGSSNPDYYQGVTGSGTTFTVTVNTGDPNTVMSSNFPHKFVDTTNASITVSYTEPGEAAVNNQVLTPDLLSDGIADNDGPTRSWYNIPFANEEWSYLPDQHIDLTGVHTEGDFSDPDFEDMPVPQLHFIGTDVLSPGIILLLDRSGSMGVETNGVSAAQFVQEAGLYLYHSSTEDSFVGAYVYNDEVDPLFAYAEYDPNYSPGATLDPVGATNIALALETAIDAFIAEHGEGNANGGQIFLMSDGKQTVGNDLFDQVDRANKLGIKIHTFTYGNADAATMAQISSTTAGDDMVMSETKNGSELKIGMAKELSLMRGDTPLYSFKGKLKKTGVSGGQEYFQAAFQVQPTAQNLRVYAFRANGNASELDIRLKDSNGQSHLVAPTQLTNKGRFAGTRIETPQPGKWIVRIMAKRLPEDTVEIVAYADDRNLDGQAWFKSGQNSISKKMQLHAFLNYQYPLTKMQVRAHLYRDDKRVASVRMYDDGKNGGDYGRADGIYSAELDMRRLWRKLGLKWLKNQYGIQNPKVRIDVQYKVSKKSVPAPNHHYETGIRYQDLLDDYRPAEFEAWTTLVQAFAKKSRKPVLQRIRSRTATPGRNYRTTVTVFNARPQADQIRLSMGRGIQARVDRVRPRRDRLGVTLSVSYHVQDDALPGKRDLKIQFGDALLVGKGVVNVSPGANQRLSTNQRARPTTTTVAPSIITPTVGVGTLQSD